MSNKTIIMSAITALLLSASVQASESFVLQPVSDANTVAPSVKFDDSGHYFIGVTGGKTNISMTAITTNSSNDSLSSPDSAGFVGANVGYYTAGGAGRLYYSWQKMTADSNLHGSKAIETDVILHLLNADYIFRADKSINPFIGAHLGYMIADSKGHQYGSHSQSGEVLGIQAGVAWRISNNISAEVGVRHTATQGEDTKPWSSNKIISQIKSVSTGYASLSYRF